MSILNSILGLLKVQEPDVDPAEWDASDPAGDESEYDGLAVAYAPYDHTQFAEVTEDANN